MKHVKNIAILLTLTIVIIVVVRIYKNDNSSSNLQENDVNNVGESSFVAEPASQEGLESVHIDSSNSVVDNIDEVIDNESL